VSKSSAAEQIQRVNMAVQMLNDQTPSPEVLATLTTRYGVSRRQAFRYLRQAQANAVLLPVPTAKTVFTVKLPADLAEQIRQRARHSQQTISAVVAEALRAYLKRGTGHG
jgi:hypothetical protein